MSRKSNTTAVSHFTPLRRECFITVGATASFRSLIDIALTAIFIDCLRSLGYTNLTIQCGPDLSYANARLREEEMKGLQGPGQRALGLKLFDFRTEGLGDDMRRCKAVHGEVREGLVVSHAGAGTILDAMRLDVPIIVVPNPSLLDNHQAELAEELERQGYVTYGHLNAMPAALRTSEEKCRARKAWQSAGSEAEDANTSITGVLDEELGYEWSTREVLD